MAKDYLLPWTFNFIVLWISRTQTLWVSPRPARMHCRGLNFLNASEEIGVIIKNTPPPLRWVLDRSYRRIFCEDHESDQKIGRSRLPSKIFPDFSIFFFCKLTKFIYDLPWGGRGRDVFLIFTSSINEPFMCHLWMTIYGL